MAKSKSQAQVFDIIDSAGLDSPSNIDESPKKRETPPSSPNKNKKSSISTSSKRTKDQINVRVYDDMKVPLKKIALDEGYAYFSDWACDLFEKELRKKGYL